MEKRREISREYKERKRRMGVYQIRNTSNGETFIDSSTALDTIWNRIKFELSTGHHRNRVLQDEWNRFGEMAFEFSILAELNEEEMEGNYRKELKTLLGLVFEESGKSDDA